LAHESIRHLGFDELREITLDKWDEEVWGAAHTSPTNVPRPKLFFYFAEEDPWVAGHTRDYLMKIRGREKGGDGWKPRMEIDQLKTPHAFCLGEYSSRYFCIAPEIDYFIEYSDPVADKVAKYIDTIVELERTSTTASSSQTSLGETSFSSAKTVQDSSKTSSIRS
jgi:hypothetical protein